MALDTTITIPANTWTLLTGADVFSVSIQNQSVRTVELKATSGTTPPTDNLGSRLIKPFGGPTADYTLAEVWPGVLAANRVWAYCDGPATVAVSYA